MFPMFYLLLGYVLISHNCNGSLYVALLPALGIFSLLTFLPSLADEGVQVCIACIPILRVCSHDSRF
jgi:hypothetical protein